MTKKLTRDSIAARVAAAKGIASLASRMGNRLAQMQLESQMMDLDQEMEAVSRAPARTASVALFFGGDAVIGSAGIKAQFAGKVLEDFQDLISKRFAYREVGPLGERGRVSVRPQSELMVTGVAKGSFGFVLEEAAIHDELIRTNLADTVSEITLLVEQLASPIEETFELAIEEMDQRILQSANRFFETLDSASASMRIVEGDHEVNVGPYDVHRAYARTSSMQVAEKLNVELVGKLYVLPKSRRFEFRLNDQEVISGVMPATVAEKILTGFDSPIGKQWRARFNLREVRRRKQQPKQFYTLVNLMSEVDGESPSALT